MADSERLGASFSIDVTNLKAGLTQANRLIRESESQFKAAAAGMDDWSKSEEGLNARIKSLSEVTDLQKKKINALKAEYQNLIDGGLDPTSKQATELRTKINNEQAALNANEKELKEQKEALKNVGKETEEAGKGFEKFGEMAKTAGKIAVGAVAAASAAVGVLVKEAVSSYAEYEQLVGGVDTLFKESSSKVQEYANEAYKTAGMSANEYMETVTGFSASLLQSLGGDTEKAADYADMAITDMADNANKMGTSIESLQNAYGGFAKGNFTMLDNLKLGYGGTKEEMQRLLDDAEKLSGVKYDLSSYADIVDAIHVVQTELEITGTTAKEASSTISGSLASMKSAWSNVLTGIADDEADMDSLITNLVDSISTVADNLIPRIKIALNGVTQLFEALIEQLPPLVAEILPELIDGAMSLIDGVVKVLPQLVQMIVDIIPQIATELLNMTPTLLQAAIDIIGSIIDGLTDMLPDIVNAIVDVIPKLINALMDSFPTLLDAAINLLTAIVDAVPEIVVRLLDELPRIVDTIIDGITAAIPELIDAAIQLLDAIVEAIPTIIEAITDNLPLILDSIMDGLTEAFPALLEGAIQLFMAIVDALPEILDSLKESLPTIIEAVADALIDCFPLILDAGVDLFMALVKALPEVIELIIKDIPELIGSILKALDKAIPDLLKGFLKALGTLLAPIAKKQARYGMQSKKYSPVSANGLLMYGAK